MATPFSRTLRSLHADDSRRSARVLLMGAVLVLVWTGWALASEVPVYEQSPTASLQVADGVHTVQSPAAGAIETLDLGLGERVEAGQVLVRLDTSAQEKALAEKRAELIALEERLEALDALRRAELEAVAAAERAGSAAVGEARARARTAEPRRERMAARADRLERLKRVDAASAAELEDARSEAAEAERAMAELEQGVAALSADHRFRVSDRRVRLSELSREAAELRAAMKTVVPAIERLTLEVEKRKVGAPCAGVLGQVTSLRKGGFVDAGDTLFTVIPDGELRAVAMYPAWRALGRIEPGQPARLRMQGFSWTQYGSVRGQVASIGNEARDGLVRVELSIAHERTPIPLQHGLRTTVEIEVERVSPATLILRAAGKLMEPEPAPSVPSATPPTEVAP